MTQTQYILTLDQGTTSSRAIIFDHDGQVVASAQKEFQQFYPKPGWVEHDPNEIWSTQSSVAAEAVSKAGINGNYIAGIGITNQRETTIIWDRDTGKPIYNAIVWQDRRTADFCDALKSQHGAERIIKSKTGLVIDAYFSASKIKWILDNVAGAKEKAANGQLMFGTVDSWLIYKFTNGRTHVTDVTNASRTMLFNIHDMAWDNDLLDLFEIPRSLLPDVCQSSEVISKTSTTLFASKLPIAGVAGDQQSALFGQMCVEEGMMKTTYGTGCFMMMNVGDKPKESANKLLSTVAWQINGKVTYALEGSIFIGGAIIQWLRDELQIINNAKESEMLAQAVEDNGGVYIVPALSGLGAPHWDPTARGCIIGLTRGSSKKHIARAALESIAYQVHDIVRAKEYDTGIDITEMRVDGGAVANDFLMQFQSDVLQSNVIRPTTLETTALGAAYLAGLAVGYWDSIETLQKKWTIDRQFKPGADKNDIAVLLKHWNRALLRAKGWSE